MTFREATIEAWMELGMSRETAELRAKVSDGFVPDAAALAQSPVKLAMITCSIMCGGSVNDDFLI